MRNVDGVKFGSNSVIVVYNVSKMCIMFLFENSLNKIFFIRCKKLGKNVTNTNVNSHISNHN